jgi:hypothetical protein
LRHSLELGECDGDRDITVGLTLQLCISIGSLPCNNKSKLYILQLVQHSPEVEQMKAMRILSDSKIRYTKSLSLLEYIACHLVPLKGRTFIRASLSIKTN